MPTFLSLSEALQEKAFSPPVLSLSLVVLVTPVTRSSGLSHGLHLGSLSSQPLTGLGSPPQTAAPGPTLVPFGSPLSHHFPMAHLGSHRDYPQGSHNSWAPLPLEGFPSGPDPLWAWSFSPNLPPHLDLPTALSPRQMIFTLSSASYFSWSSSQGLAVSPAICSWVS